MDVGLTSLILFDPQPTLFNQPFLHAPSRLLLFVDFSVQPPHMAGALGFEPRLSVLETDVLPLTPCPFPQHRQPIHRPCRMTTCPLSLRVGGLSLPHLSSPAPISLLCELCVFGKIYRTYSALIDQGRSFCSWWWNSYAACTLYKLDR